MLNLVAWQQVNSFFGFELLFVLLACSEQQLISAAFPLFERSVEEMVGRAVSNRRAFYAFVIDVYGASSATVLWTFNEFYCWTLSFVRFLLLYEGKLVAIPLNGRA